MLDRYGRRINYLRISVTDRCNLRCVYCMPEEGVQQFSHEKVLTYDEITRIVSIAAGLGITRIKLTGGEPLVRKGLPDLVRMLKALPGIEQVTLTTNGVLLKEMLPELTEAGLDGVNISLDTCDRALFMKIARRDSLDRVLEGIEAAQQYQGLSVKLNCVPVSGEPDDILKIVSFAKDYPVHVRFIEMMPIGLGKQFFASPEESAGVTAGKSAGLSGEEIREIIEKRWGPLEEVSDTLGNGPSRYYRCPGLTGKIGLISAVSHPFCDSCNRVRLTSDGFLKACLQYDSGADLRELLRSGAEDAQIAEAMQKVIYEKPASHSFSVQNISHEEAKIMSQIGG